jgi:hypothetical protein
MERQIVHSITQLIVQAYVEYLSQPSRIRVAETSADWESGTRYVRASRLDNCPKLEAAIQRGQLLRPLPDPTALMRMEDGRRRAEAVYEALDWAQGRGLLSDAYAFAFEARRFDDQLGLAATVDILVTLRATGEVLPVEIKKTRQKGSLRQQLQSAAQLAVTGAQWGILFLTHDSGAAWTIYHVERTEEAFLFWLDSEIKATLSYTDFLARVQQQRAYFDGALTAPPYDKPTAPLCITHRRVPCCPLYAECWVFTRKEAEDGASARTDDQSGETDDFYI